MEKKTNPQENLLPVSGVMLAMCAFADIIAMIAGNGTAFYYFYSIVVVLIAAFGAVYIFTGCKKGVSAGFFRGYLILNAVSTLLLFLNPTVRSDVFLVCCLILGFVGFCVLAIVKDLGETRSKIIAGAIALITAICTICILVSHGASTMIVSSHTTQVVSYLSLIVLVGAKYKDKRARGTY